VPGLSHARAYGALLLIVGLWGSYPALAKLALQDVPPVILVALRGVVASAFLVAMLARSGAGAVNEITPAALRAFAVLAMTGVVGSMQLTYVSLYYTTATNVVLLQVATPVMVALAICPSQRRLNIAATPTRSPPAARRLRRSVTSCEPSTASRPASRRLHRDRPKMAMWTTVSGFIATANAKIA
jgi:uncharacterized membrane protein